jgi:hypothetical protein
MPGGVFGLEPYIRIAYAPGDTALHGACRGLRDSCRAALVPASLRKLAPAGVVLCTLGDPAQVVRALSAWWGARRHPLVWMAAVKLAAKGGH